MALQLIALFCEDIREEVSGQHTLVGILPDIIDLPPAPAGTNENARPRLPKLAVYFRFHFGVDDAAHPINIKLRFASGHETSVGTIDKDLVQKAQQEAKEAKIPMAGLRFTAVYQSFRIESFGVMSALAEVGGEQYSAGVLNFRVVA